MSDKAFLKNRSHFCANFRTPLHYHNIHINKIMTNLFRGFPARNWKHALSYDVSAYLGPMSLNQLCNISQDYERREIEQTVLNKFTLKACGIPFDRNFTKAEVARTFYTVFDGQLSARGAVRS